MLLQRHPNREDKLRDAVDLRVRANRLQTCPELMVVRRDGSEEAILWVKCVSGKPMRTSLLDLCRMSIQDQIREFRDGEKPYCAMCGAPLLTGRNGNAHVDHIVHFATLVKEWQSSIAQEGGCWRGS